MAGINLTLPSITMEDLQDDAKLQKILSYLYQLNEQLRYELTHIDDDNISKEGISEASLTSSVVRTLTGQLGAADLILSPERFRIEMQKKAEKTYVDSSLEGKVDQTEYDGQIKEITESVAELELTSERFGVEIEKKVEKTYVDAAVGDKVSQSEYDGQITQITENIAALELTSEQFSVELSEKVSQKDVDESIENIDEFHNTAFSITARGMEMNTTGSIRAIVDGDEELTIDEDGVSAKRLVAREEIYAPNLLTKHMSNVIPWKGAIQASLEAIPKHLAQDTTLTIPSGTFYEDVSIRGFVGAKLTILFNEGAGIIGTVTVSDCSRVTLEAKTLGDGCIYTSEAKETVTNDGSCLTLRNLYVSGYRRRLTATDGSKCAVLVRGGCCHIEGCGLEYADYGALFTDGATGFVKNTRGGQSGADPLLNCNLLYGLYAANGAHVAATGTAPMGGTNATGSALATLMTGEITPTAGGMEYVPPAEVTKTFFPSSNCTYRRGSDIRVGGQFTQGVYGSYASGIKWSTGAMWFAGATAELAGKTIKSATLTLRRASGGSSSPRNVYLGTVALTEANYDSTNWPTFTPSASNYPGAQIAREGEMTYDVTELMGAVQQGYAIAVSEPIDDYGGNWSPHYAQFYGVGSEFEPVLTVTYS